MRRLSVAQARRCENAKDQRCRCRCGGALHGRGQAAEAEDLASLPEGDPHHITERQLMRALERARAS